MEIGALRQRITLERLSTFVNESGFETESWEEVGTVWAAKKSPPGELIQTVISPVPASSSLLNSLGLTSSSNQLSGAM
jgi:hypothetical protein